LELQLTACQGLGEPNEENYEQDESAPANRARDQEERGTQGFKTSDQREMLMITVELAQRVYEGLETHNEESKTQNRMEQPKFATYVGSGHWSLTVGGDRMFLLHQWDGPPAQR